MKKLSLVVSFLILLISSACFGSPGTQAGAARSESSPPQQQPATPEETVPDAGMQAEYVEIKRLVRDREQAMQDGNKCAQLVTRTECVDRSEEHTSELQSIMRISYAVFCLKKKK